jgi:acetoin utilization protein AcuB
MTPDPVLVSMDDTLAKLHDIFDTHQFHHLLVVENKRLVGVVSDRDYLKAISPNIDKDIATRKELATLNKRVHQIMNHHPVTVNAADSIQVAVEKFRDNNVSCLPVLDDNDRVVGILSWRNLLRGMRVKKGSG